MAKHIRPIQVEENTVIRNFAMKWSSSAHVKSFSIGKAN